MPHGWKGWPWNSAPPKPSFENMWEWTSAIPRMGSPGEAGSTAASVPRSGSGVLQHPESPTKENTSQSLCARLVTTTPQRIVASTDR